MFKFKMINLLYKLTRFIVIGTLKKEVEHSHVPGIHE